ncbi:MAG: hypothetical protein OHK0047_06860 [Leptolyngbyaceae cyanobacterium]
MTPEQEQAIADLRARNVAPKQIARQLGLRPAEVSAVIKAQAEQVTAQRMAKGELSPVFQCLVNRNCLDALLPDDLKHDPALAFDVQADLDPNAGIAVVTVARKAGFNRLDVCTYLVDIWCLGVKDVAFPRVIDLSTYKDFVDFAYQAFPDGSQEIPLQLAQAIVLGSVDYAARLGFQPHRDFEQARALLGEWDGQPVLNFGRDGKPYYMSGPYDDPLKVLRTLRETVGEGNFNYTVGSGDEW